MCLLLKQFLFLLSLLSVTSLAAQGTWYVNPSASANGSGTQASPFNNIPAAIDFAALNGGGEVLVTAGTHVLMNSQRIFTTASAAAPVTLKPETPFTVKFEFADRSAFRFEVGSSHLTLQGFEIDGNTDQNDFWCTVAVDFWSIDGNPDGGGLAVIADGEHLNILDNYIHDCYQKGVEIADGRYVNIQGNIIRNIAQYSLSGGHGIMRQQAGDLEYDDPDDPNTYRWDINGNLIYNVEQRIYSWVPRKGFIEMVIDEGKSILIDDPKNTNGVQDQMTARIKNNVVAFGAVDHIRLKSTPGLEVSNNSIYSEGENGDGITDKGGDPNPGGPNTLFTNFTAHGNAVQCVSGIFAIEIDHCLGESYGSGNDPQGNTPPGAVTNNYVAVGKYKPRNEANVGITDLGVAQLFVNPNGGNFNINPTLGLPAGVGVDPAVLTALEQRGASFGVNIAWDGWITDHLKLTQTILDNIPGLNDCVADNHTVLDGHGEMSANYHTIEFQVVDGAWKQARNSPSRQNFELNEEYFTWYASVAQSILTGNAEEYERIRWGNSEVKQDQCFDPDWLTVSQISGGTMHTVINGYDNNFFLAGDLLVDFENFTPSVGAHFDLVVAGAISAANGTDFFDRVLFEGFTPDNYSLEVIDEGNQQVLRLTILEALPVELSAFSAVAVDGKYTQLAWTTLSESGNDYFSVERSADGNVWQAIGRVNGVGESATANTYTFTDEDPLPGDNYYRLRQVDMGGATTYSAVEIVGFAEAGITVFPNPVSDWLTISGAPDGATIRLLDAQGRDLTGERLRRNQNQATLDVLDLPAGIYFISVGEEVRKIRVR